MYKATVAVTSRIQSQSKEEGLWFSSSSSSIPPHSNPYLSWFRSSPVEMHQEVNGWTNDERGKDGEERNQDTMERGWNEKDLSRIWLSDKRERSPIRFVIDCSHSWCLCYLLSCSSSYSCYCSCYCCCCSFSRSFWSFSFCFVFRRRWWVWLLWMSIGMLC